MKSQLRTIVSAAGSYTALMFCCPGCAEIMSNDGLHMLPVNNNIKSPSWKWNGSVDLPTLEPSILTRYNEDKICHCFLRDGVFEFLSDCTHSLAGQKIKIGELPRWTEYE